MFLSAIEAQRKLCPYMTYCINEEHVTHYDKAPIMAQASCATSDCMAWRFDNKLSKGYCGLSGRSE